jgi:isopentenyldiphosphate isomerase
MADTMLSVVNDNDEVVGKELRSVIHKTGLRHREIHVWFVTPDGDLIAQRRGANKDTFPSMLDATAGGHVEEGQDYLTAALAEIAEETGWELFAEDLIELAKADVRQVDEGRGVDNKVFRMVYLHRYTGSMDDLEIEEHESAGAGFVKIPLEEILMQSGKHVDQLVPGLFGDGYMPAWHALRKALLVS